MILLTILFAVIISTCVFKIGNLSMENKELKTIISRQNKYMLANIPKPGSVVSMAHFREVVDNLRDDLAESNEMLSSINKELSKLKSKYKGGKLSKELIGDDDSFKL